MGKILGNHHFWGKMLWGNVPIGEKRFGETYRLGKNSLGKRTVWGIVPFGEKCFGETHFGEKILGKRALGN